MSGPAYLTCKGSKHIISKIAQACGMGKEAADYTETKLGTMVSVFVGVPTGGILGMARASKENYDTCKHAK